MGNVATKERPRSNSSVSYVVYSQNNRNDTSSGASGAGSSRRSLLRSTPTDSASSSSSSRHAGSRKGKSKNKYKYQEPTHNLVLDTSESVDGGYLQPQGVYPGPHDFNYKIVRQLLIDRKLAPFYKGLAEYKTSWSDKQLLAALRDLPIDSLETPSDSTAAASVTAINTSTTTSTTIAAAAAATATTTDADISPQTKTQQQQQQQYSNDVNLPTNTGSVAVPIVKSESTSDSVDMDPLSTNTPSSATSASLSHSLNSQADSIPFPPIEIETSKTSDIKQTDPELAAPSNPKPHPASDPTQHQILLYRNAVECPICFLFYPNLLNLTRCCVQPICSECFVQIKRAPPHHPEEDTEDTQPKPEQNDNKQEIGLISEPACCPFCMTPNMGVTYTPPLLRTGLGANPVKRHHSLQTSSLIDEANLVGSMESVAITSSSSLTSAAADDDDIIGYKQRETATRRGSLPATADEVITTDQIRPEWSLKLATARAYAARKSAAATAIHASAFINNEESSSSGRSRQRRATDVSGNGRHHRSLLASTLSGRRASETDASTNQTNNRSGEGSRRPPPRSMVDPTMTSPRLQELEDMMLMEAIRLSILEEEKKKALDAESQRQNVQNSALSSSSTAATSSSNEQHQAPPTNVEVSATKMSD